MPSQRAERGKKPVAYLFFVVFYYAGCPHKGQNAVKKPVAYLFFVVYIFIFFLHGSRKPVMYTLIEPGLKPD